MSNETELEERPTGMDRMAEAMAGPGAGDDALGALSSDLSWSPGMLLKRGREQQGLSREDLSVQTKLSVATIRALEEDDFDTLSEPVYTRGYYRRCAHVINLPSGEVVRAYERASGEPPPQPQPLKPSYGQQELRSPARWMPYLFFMVAAACLVIAVMWWNGRSQAPADGGQAAVTQDSGQASATTGPSAPASTLALAPASDGAPAVNAPSTSADGTATPAPLPANAGSPPSASTGGAAQQSAPSSAAAPAPAANSAKQTKAAQAPPSTQSPAPVAAASGAHALKLAFQQKSWVQVTDANGKTLLSGLMNGGTQKKLTGKPPYDVLLGYAPGVKVAYGGKTIPLDSYVRSNNTAHLTVGQSQ